MYLMSPLFCEKGGILFKGGHYLRKYGNHWSDITYFWIWISYLNFALVSSDLAEKTVNVYTCAFCLYFRRNKSELLQVAVQSLPPVVSPNEIVRSDTYFIRFSYLNFALNSKF